MKERSIMRTSIFIMLVFCSFLAAGQTNSRLQKSGKLIEKSAYLKALPLLNAYIEKDTTNSEAYAQRGVCLMQKGDYEPALNDLQRAIRINPTNEKAYTTLGSTYAMLEKFDLSLENFNKAISINSSYAVAYSSRGALYSHFLNEYDKALADYTHSIELDPKGSHAYYNRAIEYNRRKMYTEALADLNLASWREPRDHLIHHEKGTSYMGLGKYRKAIRNFKKSIKYNNKINPFEKLENNWVYRYISVCYEKLGNERKAKKYSKMRHKKNIP